MAAGAMAPPIPRPAVFLGNRAAVPTAAAAVATAGNAASIAVGGANKRQRFVSQITPPSPASGMSGPTPVSQAGFRRLVPGKGQQLTLLSLEVHADTRYTAALPHACIHCHQTTTAQSGGMTPEITYTTMSKAAAVGASKCIGQYMSPAVVQGESAAGSSL